MVIKGKQEDAGYCFKLAVQSTFAMKHPVELLASLQVGGKNGGNDKGDKAEQTSQGKKTE